MVQYLFCCMLKKRILCDKCCARPTLIALYWTSRSFDKMQPVFRSLHFQELMQPWWLQSGHNWQMQVSDDAFARLMAEVYAASLEEVT